MPDSIAPKPPKLPVQYIMESIVDLVAIVALSFLTYAGKVPQWPAIVVIALLAGVRISDLGSINRPGGGPGGPSGAGGAGGIAGLLIGMLSGGTAGWHRAGDLAHLAFRAIALATVGMAIACSSSCVHRDGRAFTGPEYAAAANQVWKFTLAAAHAACDVIDSPAGDAASVVVQGAAVPIAVARGACGLYNAADPRAVGVLVHSDGTGHVMGGAL